MSFQDFLNEKEEEGKEDKVMGAIIEFFSTHEKPTDEEIRKMAEELNVTEPELEGKIYALLSSFFDAGDSKKNPPKDVDPEQLKMGIEVEYEHTTSEAIARKIAMDHLSEDKLYYTKLKKMESGE